MTDTRSMIDLFEAARRVSVPIITIHTADQSATVDVIRRAAGEFPVIEWDAVRGMHRSNQAGENALRKANIQSDDTVSFTEALLVAQKLERGSIVLCHNAHRQLQSQEPLATAAAVQAVANVRDTFKLSFRCVVLMGPNVPVPNELAQDVITLTHALPDGGELETIIKELHTSAKLPEPDADTITRAVDAVSGLSSFGADQVVAMSLTPRGLDLDAVWERKRITIEQTRGLAVWRGGDRFDDLVGLDAIKQHLRMRIHARTPIGCVVWLDEIDKALANVESDTSGVRMDQLRTLLTEMEDHEWRGLIAVGVPGGGKSAIAKALGNEAGVPTIALDLGDTESKWVGESEANVRQAMAVINAIGRGHAYVIATSNNASVMRPELQRRFTDGLWFVDLLSPEERAACWVHYKKHYQLTKKQSAELPEDGGWTGAEIRNCCRYAWDTNCTLVEAARFIVPMARSRANDIDNLRRHAHRRFLNASIVGPYEYESAPMVEHVRAIALPPLPTDTLKHISDMKES